MALRSKLFQNSSALVRCTIVPCRYGHKPNVKKPWPGPLERRVFEAVTKAIIPQQLPKPVKKCKEALVAGKITKENPYQDYLIRRYRSFFDDHPAVVVCQKLSSTKTDETDMWRTLKRHGCEPHFDFPNELLKTALSGTKWANLTVLANSINCYIFMKEPNINILLKELRKMPKLIPLGGVIDGTLVSKDGLQRYAQLPGLDGTRSQLAATIGYIGGGQTSSLLARHQSKLSSLLDQYVRQSGETDNDQTDSNTPAS